MSTGTKSKKRSLAGPPQRRATSPRNRSGSLPSPPPRDQRRVWQLSLLLAAATFAVYFPVLKHPFVNYDDVDYVTENSRVQQGVTGDTLLWAFTSMQQGNWHPLTWLSHALDCELFGLEPGGHHFTSLLLQALNAVLVFLLLQQVTGKMWRSLLVAVLFALHPINVESVAWVAERKSTLSMFLFLLTLAAYGWYTRKPKLGPYLAVFGLFAMALAAKPMVVTLPFVLLLIDVWPLRRVENQLPPSKEFPVPQFHLKRLLLEKVPLLALSAASCAVTLMAQRPAMKSMEAFPAEERLSNATFSYAMYLWKAIWPLHLGVFYSPARNRLAGWQIALSLAFLAVVAILAWRGRARPYLAIGWLWFLGTLVPMIGLVQVGEQGMADRYAYLPFLGIFAAAVWGISDLAASRNIRWRWKALGACSLLIILSILTRRQLRTWESSYALWSHSLEITRDNYVAEDFVGTTLMEKDFNANGQICADEALVHFENAIRINPEDSIGQLNVGFCWQAHGRVQDAIEKYQLALQSSRTRYLKSRANINLATAYEELGNLAAARDHYHQALGFDPRNREIRKSLDRLETAERIASAAPQP